MNCQAELDETMRAVLVDWIIDVHDRWELSEDTLFLCVNLIDRYLYGNIVPRSKFQLVGVACLFIASKYEDDSHPSLLDCCKVMNNTYSQSDLVDIEQSIMEYLNWRLSGQTINHFLNQLFSVVGADSGVERITRYFAYRSLLEHDFLQYRYCDLSCACLILSLNVSQALLSGYAPGSIVAKCDINYIPPLILASTLMSVDSIVDLCHMIYSRSSERYVIQHVDSGRIELLSATEHKFNLCHGRW